MRIAHLLTRRFFVPIVTLAVVGISALFPACDSLSSFTGQWQGEVSTDPNLAHGFTAASQLGLNIKTLDNGTPDMTVLFPGAQDWARFEPVKRASSDAVGSLELPGDPLRSYLGYVRPAGQESLLMFVSLFPPNHVEARVIRGPDEIYGVFRLSKL
jgi:hypothetical protein